MFHIKYEEKILDYVMKSQTNKNYLKYKDIWISNSSEGEILHTRLRMLTAILENHVTTSYFKRNYFHMLNSDYVSNEIMNNVNVNFCHPFGIFILFSIYLPSYHSRAVDYRHQEIEYNAEKVQQGGIFHSNFIIDFMIVLCLTCGKHLLVYQHI